MGLWGASQPDDRARKGLGLIANDNRINPQFRNLQLNPASASARTYSSL